MSAYFTIAQKNRILALRAVAARNSDPSTPTGPSTMTYRESRRAKFSVIEGRAANPWQPEGNIAA